jgi:hypothetical protein
MEAFTFYDLLDGKLWDSLGMTIESPASNMYHIKDGNEIAVSVMFRVEDVEIIEHCNKNTLIISSDEERQCLMNAIDEAVYRYQFL